MTEQPEMTLRTIALDDLDACPAYPPERLDGLDDLREAIESSRLIIPPVVMPSAGGRYVLLDGHRRVAVARLLHRDTLPCFVSPTTDDPVTAFAKLQLSVDAEQRVLPFGRRISDAP